MQWFFFSFLLKTICKKMSPMNSDHNKNIHECALVWLCRQPFNYAIWFSMQATQRHLYTSKPSLVCALHPCLLSILKVLEPSPLKPKFGRKVGFYHVVLHVYHKKSMYGSRKLVSILPPPPPPHGRSLEIPSGVGGGL